MELVINYGLYFVAFVCILVPLFGFGIAPPLVIKAALGIFGGNAYSQIVQGKLLKNLIKEKKDSGNNTMTPALEAIQNQIDMIEDRSLRKKKLNEHGEHGHHIIPVPVYVGVLLLLLVGTVITVWVAQFDFGAWNTIIAMLVATIKASFVLGFFMHLKYDNMMNRVIFMSGFFFLLILIAFSAADIFTRVALVF